MASPVRDEIVESMKAFIRENNGQVPTTIYLPWEKAYDLMKLDEYELPGLSTELMRRGVLALNELALFGMEVRVDYEKPEIVLT